MLHIHCCSNNHLLELTLASLFIHSHTISIWNSLPSSIVLAPSLNTFKFLLSNYNYFITLFQKNVGAAPTYEILCLASPDVEFVTNYRCTSTVSLIEWLWVTITINACRDCFITKISHHACGFCFNPAPDLHFQPTMHARWPSRHLLKNNLTLPL